MVGADEPKEARRMKTQEDQLALLRDEVQAIRTVADAERFAIGGLLPMRETGISEEEAGATLLVILALVGFRLPCGCPPALRLTTFPEAHFAEVKICHQPGITH